MEGDGESFRLTTTAAALGSVAEWTIGRFLGEKGHVEDRLGFWKHTWKTPRLWETLHSLFMRFSLPRIRHWSTRPSSPVMVQSCTDGSWLNRSPSPDRICADQSKWSSGSYFPLWPRLFFSNSLFRHSAARRVLVDPNFFLMSLMETTELLETITEADFVF